MADRYVYSFGGGAADGSAELKALLGGKGAGLAEMARLGIPVPPGFTLTTEVCIHYQDHGRSYPAGLRDQVAGALARVEELQGQRFGDPERPLLLSVRSGAAISMPGMMDTVLNLGLNRDLVDTRIEAGEDPRFVRDAYRRLLTMYGDVVLGVAHREFEGVLERAREEEGVATDAELSAEALAGVIEAYERLIEDATGAPFPRDPHDQLWGGIAAVFDSWDNERARSYRRLNRLPGDMGTAVNVQAMVFGNRGPDCATGVAFTRNPATGEKVLYGEYLVNAQGEDVVAGIRTPLPIEGNAGEGALTDAFPEAHAGLVDVARTLEERFGDMQDVEFTIEAGALYMLQTRTGKRTGPAAVRIAADMVDEGLIEPRRALERVEPRHLIQLLAPEFDEAERDRAVSEGRRLAGGLPAGPGAASGRIALTADRAAEMTAHGPVLLVRQETSPEDIVGMHAAAGILTSRGGMTSHAAVVARGLGKPCVVGAGGLTVDEEAGEVRAAGQVFREGDELSIDGTAGEVIAGALPTRSSQVLRVLQDGGEETPAARAFLKVLEWADGERRLRVRANADTPADARAARAFGAEGIGLCRTEHMFFEEERIPWVRRMILASDAGERQESLDRLRPVQQGDFEGIFQAMEGLPVTVRLLDPPLHEFLPHEERAQRELAREMGLAPDQVAEKVTALFEVNPMLGHRGCRLGITAPEIYRMQADAIVRAACNRQRAGDRVLPEIMVPLVGTEEELARIRTEIEETARRVQDEEGVELEHLLIGTMIEVPRAALVADRIARHAEFFSFGTNDLTQMTYGYSRDDVGRFLPQYVEDGIVPADPFATLDRPGVGELVRIACEKGRAERSGLHLGICGEHGGDPESVAFFEEAGLDYVSCSPFRVAVARLAAARARLGLGPGGED
ncbi:MAG: pyruvate, phosphate dikinase [Thermoanaerobaculia bacterium]